MESSENSTSETMAETSVKRPMDDDVESTALTESSAVKKVKLEDDYGDAEKGNETNGVDKSEPIEMPQRTSDSKVGQNTDKTTSPSSNREKDFTSEIFKIEILNLPKHTGYAQLKKFLSKLGLEPRKLKLPPGNLGALVTFGDEDARQRALKVINEGVKLKGRELRAIKCKPQVDPYVKAQANKKEIEPPSMEALKAKLLQAVSPLQGVEYEQQLRGKESVMTALVKNDIENAIVKVNDDIANIIHAQRIKNLQTLQGGPRCEMFPIIASPRQVGYRNKNEFTVGVGPEMSGGQLTVGFRIGSYSDGTLTVMEPSDCKSVSPTTLTVVKRLEKFYRESGYGPFSPADHSGYWRFLTVRTSELGHVMIIVSMNVQNLNEEEIDQIKEALRSFCVNDASLCEVGIRSLYFSRVGNSNRESDQKYELLHGEETIEEVLKGMRFRISPDAFFQANTLGAELLIDTISSWLLASSSTSIGAPVKLADHVTLLDICCGTGTIGLALSKNFPRVIGVECVEKAVEDAKKNALLNGIENAEFVCGKAEVVFNDILENSVKDASSLVAVVDPPRAGLHKLVLQAIRKCEAIRRFIYVSCDPKLAKEDFLDLARPPTKKGFKGTPFLPSKAVPIDLFPQTRHCELVLLFERVTRDQIEAANKFMELRDCKSEEAAIVEGAKLDEPEKDHG